VLTSGWHGKEPAEKLVADEGITRRKLLGIFLMRFLPWVLLPTTIVVVLLVSWLLMAGVMWSSTHTWEFEGAGLRHWLFVRGSRLEKLGFVAPTDTSPLYTIQPAEGTFPGWSFVSYESSAMPEEINTHYEAGCREMGFAITSKDGREGPPATLVLICEIEPYLDIEVVASRDRAASRSKVAVKVWGME
jgi:hypothetical protein